MFRGVLSKLREQNEEECEELRIRVTQESSSITEVSASRTPSCSEMRADLQKETLYFKGT